MRVYFLRHGEAGDPAQWTGADSDRPLTAKGKERIAREGSTLRKLSLAPDLIVTSPLVRAKETAAIVAGELKMKDRLVEDERVGLDFDPGRLAAILQEHVTAKAVMLVGHEPSMSQTIGHLVGGAKIDLKKGGLAAVDLPDASAADAELVWLIPPKVLAL
jgi:phosphohistidine phosphatase